MWLGHNLALQREVGQLARPHGGEGGPQPGLQGKEDMARLHGLEGHEALRSPMGEGGTA